MLCLSYRPDHPLNSRKTDAAACGVHTFLVSHGMKRFRSRWLSPSCWLSPSIIKVAALSNLSEKMGIMQEHRNHDQSLLCENSEVHLQQVLRVPENAHSNMFAFLNFNISLKKKGRRL